jgi:glycosyltransferase involved in cell wall biosynthesis
MAARQAGGGVASKTSGRHHVVHVVAPAPFGGLESVVRSLALATHRRGDAVTVAVLLQSEDSHPFVELLRTDGVEVVALRCGRRRYFREVAALARLLRSSGATMVHAHNYHADFVGLLAARRCGLPVVTTVHGFDGGNLKARAYEVLDLWLMRWFDAVICVSERTGAQVRRAIGNRGSIRIIPNGYEPGAAMSRAEARRRLGVPADARVIGWVGRLWTVKGPDLLIEAVAQLEPDVARVVVIGEGPERTALETTCARRGLRQVLFAGAREDAAQLLRAFDVLVMSSRSEGTPMVLLEAMAAGVAVVTFAVGGIPDVVSPASAWLAPPEDVPALAAALRDALDHPQAAAVRAAEARRVLDARFGVEPWVARIEEVYASVPAA